MRRRKWDDDQEGDAFFVSEEEWATVQEALVVYIQRGDGSPAQDQQASKLLKAIETEVNT